MLNWLRRLLGAGNLPATQTSWRDDVNNELAEAQRAHQAEQRRIDEARARAKLIEDELAALEEGRRPGRQSLS